MSSDPHPLQLEKAGNPKRELEAQPISPPHSPGLLPINPLQIGKLAGITDSSPVQTPTGVRTKAKAAKLLSAMTTPRTSAAVRPYLEAAEELLDAKLATVRMSTGQECDPITAMHLSAAARTFAYASYWMDTADPDTPEGQRQLLLAQKFFDSARCGSLQAYSTAVSIARSKPTHPPGYDPLARFMTAEPDTDD